MVTSLLLSLLVAILYGWWAMWRDNTVTIASLREELAAATAALTVAERLRQNRSDIIRMRTDLQRLQAEAHVLHSSMRAKRSSGNVGGTD